jgi:CO/xanthine dehydrogenase FAD-binding subunit
VPPSHSGPDPMTLWQNYHVAYTVKDALEVLSSAQGISKIIAGGTDLLLELQQGRHPPVDTLVDITQIPEISKIEKQDFSIFIGSAVTHNIISESQVIQENCNALAIASGLIGGPQVRNTGTIGGNVAHALPAADATIALMALDAQAEITSLDGKKCVPLGDLFIGPGQSSLSQQSEILTGFYVPLSCPGQTSTFKRVMRPQGVAIAILNLALWMQINGDLIEETRLIIGPSGPIPKRLKSSEEVLRGVKLTSEIIDEVYHAVISETSFRTSRYRATKKYRELLTRVLLEEAINEVYEDLIKQEGKK